MRDNIVAQGGGGRGRSATRSAVCKSGRHTKVQSIVNEPEGFGNPRAVKNKKKTIISLLQKLLQKKAG